MLSILKLLPPNLLHPSHSNLQTFRALLFCLSTLRGSCVTLWRRSVHYTFVSHASPTRAPTGTLNADFVSGDEKRNAYNAPGTCLYLFILSGTFTFDAKKTMQNNILIQYRSQSLPVRTGDPCAFILDFAIGVNVLITNIRRIVTFRTGCPRPCPVHHGRFLPWNWTRIQVSTSGTHVESSILIILHDKHTKK